MTRERDTYDHFSEPERGLFGDNELRPARGRVTGASDLVDIILTLQQVRPLSVMVSDPAKPGGKWISLPKSLIEYRELGKGAVEVTLPESLAREKGLV
jgi:hypothetical protein